MTAIFRATVVDFCFPLEHLPSCPKLRCKCFLFKRKKYLSPSCDSKMRTILEDPFTFLKTAILCGLSKYFGLVEMTGKLVPCLDMKPRFRIPQIHVFNIQGSYRSLFFSVPLHAIGYSVNVSSSISTHLMIFYFSTAHVFHDN